MVYQIGQLSVVRYAARICAHMCFTIQRRGLGARAPG